MTSPGERAGIPLEAEPVLWLHPAQVGTVAPADRQPVDRVPALEEGPALWLRLPGGRSALPSAAPTQPAAPDSPAPARPAAPATSRPTLPATGVPRGWPAAVVVAALGWVLRRRGRGQATPAGADGAGGAATRRPAPRRW